MQDPINIGASEICKVISRALEDDDGALIGRNGTIELTYMIYNDSSSIPILERNAGVFSGNIVLWRQASIKASQSADILAAGWYEPLREAEQLALKQWSISAIQVPLRSLEPYYVDPSSQWTSYLKEHRVAIISSFCMTAKEQYEKGHTFFPSEIEFTWIQTGHPPSVAQGRNEWPQHIISWSDAVDYIVTEVISSGSRFALIGCGGLGMPIAKMLKERGVIAIVLGGSIQLLFKIKGSRWVNHELSKLWTSEWVWPSEEETPRAASSIEGGCYWKN